LPAVHSQMCCNVQKYPRRG